MFLHFSIWTHTHTNMLHHTHRHIHTSTHAHTHTHTHTRTCLRTYTHTYTHTPTHAHTHTHTHIHMPTHIYTHIHTYTNICPPHTYTQMPTHIYTHAYTQRCLSLKSVDTDSSLIVIYCSVVHEWKGDLVFISKSQRILCVSFSWTDYGLHIYHLFVWSNLNFLHNSQWTIIPTQSCLNLYSLCANLLQSLIM